MLLILSLVALALGGTVPHHPQWPDNFSTTVVMHETGVPYPRFSRWFYSKAHNVDRLDGLIRWEGEFYFAEQFFNHNTQRQYDVLYQRDASVQCFDRRLDRPLPKPDFANFTFVGEAIIEYVPVYHWIFRRDRDFFQFFDAKDTRTPVRFDAEFGNRPGLQITYTEFDGGSQNSNLFSIPSEILSVCNQINQ